jgi:hypothetical protein
LYLAILIATASLWRLQGRLEVDEMEFRGSLGGVARLTVDYVIEFFRLRDLSSVIRFCSYKCLLN